MSFLFLPIYSLHTASILFLLLYQGYIQLSSFTFRCIEVTYNVLPFPSDVSRLHTASFIFLPMYHSYIQLPSFFKVKYSILPFPSDVSRLHTAFFHFLPMYRGYIQCPSFKFRCVEVTYSVLPFPSDVPNYIQLPSFTFQCSLPIGSNCVPKWKKYPKFDLINIQIVL